MLILSLVWYYFPVYGGVHWFTGPIPTIEKDVADATDGSSTSGSLEKKEERVAVAQEGV